MLGEFLRDVVAANTDRFRIMGPDETASNRLQAVFEVTDRAWDAQTVPGDDHLAPDGRVMEVLSEHLCQGWLEGYLLTGRHGLFNCYEAFVHIVDSMFNQHAKWLKTTNHIPWRAPIASLNYLLTSHVWRQDHNGLSHQDPGFIDHVVNKKSEVVRVYLPPDTNTLLSVADHCLRSKQYVNVIVAGKQPALTYTGMDEAIAHCTRGLGIWPWASTTDGEPDVVLACAGDVPTLETVAAADLLRTHLPDLKVRVINVVDLMRLEPDTEHPHGLADAEFDGLFTADKPVIFAYHGYPSLIHRLTYRRTNHRNIHVRGYQEEGTTTTPFDMVMMNDLDRFHLVMDVIDRVPGLGAGAATFCPGGPGPRAPREPWPDRFGRPRPIGNAPGTVAPRLAAAGHADVRGGPVQPRTARRAARTGAALADAGDRARDPAAPGGAAAPARHDQGRWVAALRGGLSARAARRVRLGGDQSRRSAVHPRVRPAHPGTGEMRWRLLGRNRSWRAAARTSTAAQRAGAARRRWRRRGTARRRCLWR